MGNGPFHLEASHGAPFIPVGEDRDRCPGIGRQVGAESTVRPGQPVEFEPLAYVENRRCPRHALGAADSYRHYSLAFNETAGQIL